MALSDGLRITSANQQQRRPKLMIAVGVDTHKHQHLAVAVDTLGQLLAEITITATLAGYHELLAWIAGLEGEALVGIEGAGSYGAGLCEHLQDNGVEVFEVERPKRRERRTGKSDRLDALLAAKKVLANDGLSTPRGHGKRVALQMLLVAYRSVVSERSRLYNQLQALHVGAPARSMSLLIIFVSRRETNSHTLTRNEPDDPQLVVRHLLRVGNHDRLPVMRRLYLAVV